MGTDFRIFAQDPLVEKGAMRVKYKIYRPLYPSKRDSVIIYPPTGGSTFIDASFAEKFCAAGFTTLIIKSWPGSQINGIVDVSAYDNLTLRGIFATYHAVDILGIQVGLFGTSYGSG